MKSSVAVSAMVVTAMAGTAIGQPDLVVNGGFEGGAFGPGWVQWGDPSYTAVQSTIVYSGGFAGEFGPLEPGGVRQTLLTKPGQQVLLSFWYRAVGTENSFAARLDGVTLVSFVNSTAHSTWTRFTFLATVPSESTDLEFAFTNRPSWTYLDDVRVYIEGFGACCLGNGTCEVRLATDCAATGGVYRGDFSPCETAACSVGACCLSDGSCVATGPGGCVSRNGLYRGDGIECGGAGCEPVVFTPVALNYNFNGMVHGAAEQGAQNRDNPTGYRSISDRGLMVNGQASAINAGPLVDEDFMRFALIEEPGVLDLVHLGDRNEVRNGGSAWGSGQHAGLQPVWLGNSNQSGPQETDISGMNAVFTERSSLGVLYQVSDGGGRFDVTLRFTDGSAVTVKLEGPDWDQDQSPPPAPIGSGLAVQRKFGEFRATGLIDFGLENEPLNVAEAVVNVASLRSAGLGDFAGKRVGSITFHNPVARSPYPNPATGAGFAVLAATLGGLDAGATCYANCDGSSAAPVLNINDFVCFNNRYAESDPYANCDGSTVEPALNVNDFMCFLWAYAGGCWQR